MAKHKKHHKEKKRSKRRVRDLLQGLGLSFARCETCGGAKVIYRQGYSRLLRTEARAAFPCPTCTTEDEECSTCS